MPDKAIPSDILVSEQTFWEPDEVTGGILTLLKLVDAGELLSTYPGLFWRGKQTVFGMLRPSPAAILEKLLGTSGWGYCEYSASNAFGLSTQIPRRIHVVTDTMPEHEIPGIALKHSIDNPLRRLYGMSVMETTLCEALSDLAEGNGYSEIGEKDAIPILKTRIARLCEPKLIVPARVIAGSLGESKAVRKLVHQLFLG